MQPWEYIAESKKKKKIKDEKQKPTAYKYYK